MGNRKVFESLQNQSTWACVTWTKPPTPSLSETPWPCCTIDFSISACLHLLLCLFCLLYCNLSHYFFSHPSRTQWEGYFCLQKPAFLKMALYISPQSLKSSEFLSCPSWGSSETSCHACPPNCPLLCFNMWCSELDNSLQLRPGRGRVVSHVLQDLLLFIHWNMTSFSIYWDCWLIFNLRSSRTSDPFLNWPGFQPHNLSCEACYSYLTAQTFLLSCTLIFLMC